MKPIRHVIITFPIGALFWYQTNSLSAAIICFLSGILPDTDHIIEYIIHFGWKNFSIENCYEACIETERQEGDHRFRKLYLFLHCIELAFGLWLLAYFTKNIFIFALSLGYSLHLIIDIIGNPVYPHFYFMIVRAFNRFKTESFFQNKKKIKTGE